MMNRGLKLEMSFNPRFDYGETLLLNAAREWRQFARRGKPRLTKAASSRRTPGFIDRFRS